MPRVTITLPPTIPVTDAEFEEMKLELSVTRKAFFAEMREARARKVAEFRKAIEAAEPSREKLLDDWAELACRDDEHRIREAGRRKRDDAITAHYSPAIVTFRGAPPVEVIMKKTVQPRNGDAASVPVEMYFTEAGANALRARKIAMAGGAARTAIFKLLEDETIRLYLAKKWKSVPDAALEITPLIVEMSKRGNGDLVKSTTKPLEWIRAYNNAQKKSSPS